MHDQPTFRLTFSCPDQPGIVAKVSGFLFDSGANILSARQHRDSDCPLYKSDAADDPTGL